MSMLTFIKFLITATIFCLGASLLLAIIAIPLGLLGVGLFIVSFVCVGIGGLTSSVGCVLYMIHRNHGGVAVSGPEVLLLYCGLGITVVTGIIYLAILILT